MFGTFRYNKRTKSHEHVELQAANGVEARGYTSVACDYCRARKLKCSGQKSGCDRCVAASTICIYGQLSRDERKRHHRRQSLPEKSASQRRASGTTPNQPTHLSEQLTLQTQNQLPNNLIPPTPKHDESHSATGLDPPGSLEASELAILTPLSWTDYIMDAVNDEQNGPNELVPIPVNLPPSVADDRPTFEIDLMHDETAAPGWMESLSCTSRQTSDPALHTDARLAPLEQDRGYTYSEQPPREPDSRTTTVPDPSSPVHSLQSSKYYSACDCLATMAHFLETLGTQSFGVTGLDELLMCLGRGLAICEEVFACPDCNACADNSMLLATLVQQLGVTAQCMANKLISSATRDAHNVSTTGPYETAIWFGLYKIEMPKLRLRLVYNTVLLHLTQLQSLLNNIKDGVRPYSLAWKQVATTADGIANIFTKVKQELQEQEGTG